MAGILSSFTERQVGWDGRTTAVFGGRRCSSWLAEDSHGHLGQEALSQDSTSKYPGSFGLSKVFRREWHDFVRPLGFSDKRRSGSFDPQDQPFFTHWHQVPVVSAP